MFGEFILQKFRDQHFIEIHVCFDRQKIDDFHPKSIERKRRDSSNKVGKLYSRIESFSHAPQGKNWDTFLKNRGNKKLLVEFLGSYFIAKAEVTLHPREVLIVSGGYTESESNAHVVITETQPDGSKVKVSSETPHFFSNHDDGDTLIWLHATQCKLSTPIVLKSADTDIPHIGMPLLEKYPKKHFIIQVSESASQSEYLDLKNLMAAMSRMTDLQDIPHEILYLEMQVLYVVSGCDYVSYFDHYSKNTFLNVFLDSIIFISFKEDYCGSLKSDEH